MYDCGCKQTGGEIASPPTVSYRKDIEHDQYELVIKVNVICGCGRSGVVEMYESGWGLVYNVQWLVKKHKHEVIPVKKWPRIMEEDAVNWAIDMENLK